MSEHLTQRAIDALFTAGTAAESQPERAPRPYAFRQARRFSRQQRQLLETAFGGFAESLQTFFTFRLHRQLRFDLVTIEQVQGSDFLLSLPSPCASFEFRLRAGSEERGVLDLGTPFVLYCVDCMLGGPGGGAAVERRLTRIEQEIGRRVAELVLARLREALSDWTPLAPEILGFESNPELLSLTSTEEPILAVLLEVTDEAFAGLIALALPPTLAHALATPGSAGGDDRRSEAALAPRSGNLEQNLRLARLDLSVRMPSFGLSARAIARLRAGDVIDTGHPSDASFELCLNGRPAYLGTLGQFHRRIGLKITGRAADRAGERRDPERKGRLL